MRREGQLNLACTNCHDDNFDKRLAGAWSADGDAGRTALKRKRRNIARPLRKEPRFSYSAGAADISGCAA